MDGRSWWSATVRLGLATVLCLILTWKVRTAVGQQPAAVTPAATLRLGAWNIEWLGQPTRRNEGVPQNPEDIAKYLQASGCHLVGLMEVSWNIDTPEGPGNQTMLDALRILKERTDQDWRHVLFPREGQADRDQLCGVAWNASRVQRKEGPWPIPVYKPRQEPDAWRRPPYATHFSAGPGLTDFAFIVIHLKSNRGGVEVTSRTRDVEALSLVRALGAVQTRFREEDLVIAGDSNCLTKDEPAIRRFVAGGFRHLNEEDQPTWIKSADFAAAPFDRFFVAEFRPAFAQSRQFVQTAHHLGAEEVFRRLLSDHYLIYLDLQVLPDDD